MQRYSHFNRSCTTTINSALLILISPSKLLPSSPRDFHPRRVLLRRARHWNVYKRDKTPQSPSTRSPKRANGHIHFKGLRSFMHRTIQKDCERGKKVHPESRGMGSKIAIFIKPKARTQRRPAASPTMVVLLRPLAFFATLHAPSTLSFRIPAIFSCLGNSTTSLNRFRLAFKAHFPPPLI